MYRRMKKAPVLSLIASCLIFISTLVGMIVFSTVNAFYNLAEYLVQDIQIDGKNLFEILESANFNLGAFMVTLYVTFMFLNVVLLVACVLLFVNSIRVMNHYKLSIEDFNKKNKSHIFYIVTLGVTLLLMENDAGSYAFDIFTFTSIAAMVLLIIALANTLTYVVYAKRRYKKEQATIKDEASETYDFKEAEEPFTFDGGKQIGEEVLDKPNIQQDEEYAKRQEKLEEMYALLAKLEKQYKNGEISLEDYQRMKETILENYLKD